MQEQGFRCLFVSICLPCSVALTPEAVHLRARERETEGIAQTTACAKAGVEDFALSLLVLALVSRGFTWTNGAKDHVHPRADEQEQSKL
jgi:hypothetical protein